MSTLQHVVCQHCNATNRIPTQREDKELNCGRCHQPLFGTAPVSVSAESFEAQISKCDVPVVVDFWAPWCGPCKVMGPAFAQASANMGSAARFIKVNTDEQQALGSRYAIRSIPTIAIFKNGREVARQAGVVQAGELVRWVAAHT